MAHSHYVMDSYFPDGTPEGFRHEALRIVAADEAEAITEAKRIDSWKKPDHFQIRTIRTGARSGDKVIYNSREPG